MQLAWSCSTGHVIRPYLLQHIRCVHICVKFDEQLAHGETKFSRCSRDAAQLSGTKAEAWTPFSCTRAILPILEH